MKNYMIVMLLCVLCLCGCSPYYRITDPATDHVYYARDVKNLSGGAVKLEDERSGKIVTLQNSEVEKIAEEAYNQGVYAK
ncbi:MAG: hypothetical protein B6I25_08100 [Planctomycetales bacterium 4572_13]|nr:MAG: hypothetical protein B6I25_08100 [Planctomycetales bacterium 4572_13]